MDVVTLGAALNGAKAQTESYVESHFTAGANITITDNADGTQTIAASGEVSSEDSVARAAIEAIKDGTTIDSFGDVETALADKVDVVSGKGLSANDFTDTLKSKLDNIASGAEVNVQSDWNQTTDTADDFIKNKPTLGTAAAAATTDFATAAQGTKADSAVQGIKVNSSTVSPDSNKIVNITVPTSAADVSAIPTSAKGAASGVAELDSNGKVPSSQLPSYVDDVIEGYYYNSKFYEEATHTTEITGETGKIYIDLSGTNKTYRWSGSGYTEISESLALGETSSTAYRGDRGKTAYDHATETRLTTATASGLYKVASTAEGHIASLSSVQKSDITDLGIPAQDTTYEFEGTYNASTNKAATMADIKDGKLTGYVQASGDVAATDKVIEAIGKVEKKADDNKTNILYVADQSTQYNILPPNLERTQSNNRITLTANGDGTVTVTTESTGASANTFFGIGNVYLTAGDYYLLGGVSNLLRLQDNTDTYFDSGSGALMHITTAANYTIYLRVNSGYTNTSGVIVKPRIIPKATYDAGFTDYQPYAMSNVELTQQTNFLNDNITTYRFASTVSRTINFTQRANYHVFITFGFVQGVGLVSWLCKVDNTSTLHVYDILTGSEVTQSTLTYTTSGSTGTLTISSNVAQWSYLTVIRNAEIT